jgi:hypothetical protein
MSVCGGQPLYITFGDGRIHSRLHFYANICYQWHRSTCMTAVARMIRMVGRHGHIWTNVQRAEERQRPTSRNIAHALWRWPLHWIACVPVHSRWWHGTFRHPHNSDVSLPH